MQVHEIPRNYKGESRILYIFSIKGLIYTAVGAGVGAIIGVIISLILSLFNMEFMIIWPIIFFGIFGFCIGTFKMPESNKFKITEKTGGEAIDDVIKRWIQFKLKKNKIYIYLKEETKDE